MSEQIKKIIFTTKEAYDQKAAAGTLDPSVVYAIDASQNVSAVEVQNAVDIGFAEFGLSLGIDREGAKFYNTAIDLASMIKDIVKEKINVDFNGEEKTDYSNGTKTFRVTGITNNNTYIKAIQDDTEHGFVKFEYDINDSKPAKVTIPDAIDLTREFTLKLSNVFNTSSDTVKILPFESIAIEKLNDFVNNGGFITTEAPVIGNASFGKTFKTYNNIPYIDNMNEIGSVGSFVGLFPDIVVIFMNKAISLTEDDTDELKSYNSILLILSKDGKSYYDLSSLTWKVLPVSENVNKLAAYCSTYFNPTTN